MSETNDYTPLLPGIGLAGYRSFATWQQLLLPTKVTVLAGVNNSGKSNILRFLQHVLPTAPSSRSGFVKLEGADLPTGFNDAQDLQIGVPVRLGSIAGRHDPRERRFHQREYDLATYQESAMTLLSEDGLVYWSRFASEGSDLRPGAERVAQAIALWPDWDSNFRSVLRALGSGAVDPTDVMHRLLQGIGGFTNLPNVATIAGGRRISSGDDLDWLTGNGITRELGALERPTHDRWSDAQAQWEAINHFVQTVLGDEQAALSIPYDFSTIQVRTPNRVLPLENLGSGVEQVVVLAAAATITRGHLVCIEEPETNLHPLLQKKLIRYLTTETDNQYVIATHSAHIVDDVSSTTYHVRLTEAGSDVRLAQVPHEIVAICNDLGYRPSDLLQANCVIWVEGPSDRIYIRRWLELLDPALVEGIDYSVMFYGGALLSHLTADENALNDFIQLRQLNRASAVVIDSDKSSSRQRINSTKQRIRAEFDASEAPGFAWVTNCYTIENYIPPAVLAMAVAAVHRGVVLPHADQWVAPLPSARGAGRFDKVGIAAAAVPRLTLADLERYDLKRQVRKLALFVRAANEQSTAAT